MLADSSPLGRALPPAPTRTSAILDAVRKQLEQRRALLDGSEDLAVIQLTVRLQAGTTVVRGVQVSEERVLRRT